MSHPESYALEGVRSRSEDLDGLVARARGGDEAAFEEILGLFEGRALAIACQMGASRADAEDIAQEAFIKLFRHMGSYRGGRKFTAWFYRLVVNAARDHLSRRSPAAESLREEDPAAHLSGAAGQEGHERVRRALLLLSVREREVIVLRDLHGLGTWEIARALGVNPVTVRRHAMRARARLRELLGL